MGIRTTDLLCAVLCPLDDELAAGLAGFHEP